jgi:hypothetical protein
LNAFGHHGVGSGVGKAVNYSCWTGHKVGIGWELDGEGMGGGPSALIHVHEGGVYVVSGVVSDSNVGGHWERCGFKLYLGSWPAKR